MEGHTKDDTVKMFSSSDIKLDIGYTLEDIDKIEIVCVYEILAYWSGAIFGIEHNTASNWRCEYTIRFE